MEGIRQWKVFSNGMSFRWRSGGVSAMECNEAFSNQIRCSMKEEGTQQWKYGVRWWNGIGGQINTYNGEIGSHEIKILYSLSTKFHSQMPWFCFRALNPTPNTMIPCLSTEFHHQTPNPITEHLTPPVNAIILFPSTECPWHSGEIQCSVMGFGTLK